MNKLLRYKFRNKLFCKTNFISTIIIVVFVIILCNIIKDFQNTTSLYSVAIIDYDKSKLSKKLINDITLYKQINVTIEKDIKKSKTKLSRKIYDVVYEIKEGFQQKLENNNYDKVIKVHSQSYATEVKWINDRISLLILKEWMFNDILDRVKKVDNNFDKSKLEKIYKENNNKLLDVKIHYIKNEIDNNNYNKNVMNNQKSLLNYRENTKVFRIIWASIILFILIKIGKEIIEDRKSRIVIILEFSNISKITYYMSYLLFSIVKILISYILTYCMLGFFNNFSTFITSIFNTVIYIVLTYIIVIFTTIIIKSKKGYVIFLQLFFLVSIVLSCEIINMLLSTTNTISKLIPMYWYIK